MSKVITDEDKIQKLLSRNVEEVFVREDLENKLRSGKELRIKLGVDPTGPKIHLGRAIPLRKLREFQKMGHKIVFLIGDFTAQIGDASDKTEKRPMLSRSQIDENLKDYKNQIGKIIDLDKTEFVYNNDWLSKLTFKDVVELSDCFTVQQMLSRRNFADRYEAGTEISLREFLYPIMQGYDSVAVKADVEIGGFDQLFNVKAGRSIQEHYDMEKQNVMCLRMLEGTDGRKMSTSWGNIITIVDEPNDMFGKVMSIKDDLIIKYFELCTDIEMEEINQYSQRLQNCENPRDIKMILAETIVSMYHGDMNARSAKDNFVKVFSKDEWPDDVQIIHANIEQTLGDVISNANIVDSKSEWKRLIDSGSVETKDGEILLDYKKMCSNIDLKIGKRRFVSIRV